MSEQILLVASGYFPYDKCHSYSYSNIAAHDSVLCITISSPYWDNTHLHNGSPYHLCCSLTVKISSPSP